MSSKKEPSVDELVAKESWPSTYPRVDAHGFDDAGMHRIHIAATKGDRKQVQRMVELKVDIDLPTKNTGATPLMALLHPASSRARMETMQWLIENKASLNVADKNGRNTALMRACRWNHMDSVKLLLHHKADTTPLNEHGRDALSMCHSDGASATLITDYNRIATAPIAPPAPTPIPLTGIVPVVNVAVTVAGAGVGVDGVSLET